MASRSVLENDVYDLGSHCLPAKTHKDMYKKAKTSRPQGRNRPSAATRHADYGRHLAFHIMHTPNTRSPPNNKQNQPRTINVHPEIVSNCSPVGYGAGRSYRVCYIPPPRKVGHTSLRFKQALHNFPICPNANRKGPFFFYQFPFSIVHEKKYVVSTTGLEDNSSL